MGIPVEGGLGAPKAGADGQRRADPGQAEHSSIPNVILRGRGPGYQNDEPKRLRPVPSVMESCAASVFARNGTTFRGLGGGATTMESRAPPRVMVPQRGGHERSCDSAMRAVNGDVAMDAATGAAGGIIGAERARR